MLKIIVIHVSSPSTVNQLKSQKIFIQLPDTMYHPSAIFVDDSFSFFPFLAV